MTYRYYIITEAEQGSWAWAFFHKYQFVHKDYDGHGDLRRGSAKTLEDCKQEIDEQIFKDTEET